MAENHLDGRVIGVALDGTGFGPDGNIWGGEIILASYGEFQRAAHLNYVPMPGGQKAIHEPWRMGVSYLRHHFGQACLEFDIPFVRQLDRRKVTTLLRMAERGVNAPLTSSCGRLFDAVAALAGIRGQVNYEAQAAIELEMAIDGPGDGSAYPLALKETESGWEIGTRPLFEALLKDISERTSLNVISQRFHNGLVEVIARLAALLRGSTNLNRVCLSGGTFQNSYLLEHLTSRLEAGGFEVFTHSEVPAGDGGLSLGQAMIAAHRVHKCS
jgi:hydrogenase maturation protein HypF